MPEYNQIDKNIQETLKNEFNNCVIAKSYFNEVNQSNLQNYQRVQERLESETERALKLEHEKNLLEIEHKQVRQLVDSKISQLESAIK